MQKKKTILLFVFALVTSQTLSSQYFCSSEIHIFPGYSCVKDTSIGEGALGSAFLIQKDNKQYILKIAAEDEYSKNELEALKKFKGKPFITQLIDHYTTGSTLYMIISYGSRGTVDTIVNNTNYFDRYQNVLKFFNQLITGMKEIHTSGNLHTDIKPNNIAVTQDWEPMIIDFNMTTKIKDSKFAMGTPECMAPELFMAYFNGQKIKYDEEIDVYSLGVVFYAIIKKSFPYTLTSSNLYRNLMKAEIKFAADDRESYYKIVSSAVKPRSSRISFNDFCDLVEKEFVKPNPKTLESDVSYRMIDFANEKEKEFANGGDDFSELIEWALISGFFLLLALGVGYLIIMCLEKLQK